MLKQFNLDMVDCELFINIFRLNVSLLVNLNGLFDDISVHFDTF